MSNEVTCIKKNDRYNPYERITHIGYKCSYGQFVITQQDVIAYIEKGYEFFVNKGGKIAKLIVAISPYGNKYVKTASDGNEPNNLLSLMQCYS